MTRETLIWTHQQGISQMRLIVTFAACAAVLGLATAGSAEEVDHSAHHPADAAKPAAAPAKPSAATPAKPGMAAMPDKMQCMTMMSDKKPTDGKAMPMMTPEQRQHCTQMMAQMTPADPAKLPAK
jgi:cell division protein FtsN